MKGEVSFLESQTKTKNKIASHFFFQYFKKSY